MSKKLICEKKKYVPAATSDGMTNILETAYKSPITVPNDMKYNGFAANTYPDIKHSAPNKEISTDAFRSLCCFPAFKSRTAFLVRISIGVKEDTRIKRPRKITVVKIIAPVGQYKYRPGTCVIFAVTNKKNCEKTSPSCMPKNIERIPINMFSKKTSLFNCFWDMPSTVNIPNCFFRTFKNVPIE